MLRGRSERAISNAALAGHDVLHPAPPAREVDVRVPRARLRARLRRLRRRLRPSRDRRPAPAATSTPAAASSVSVSTLQKKVQKDPKDAAGLAASLAGLPGEGPDRRGDHSRSSATSRCARRTRPRSRARLAPAAARTRARAAGVRRADRGRLSRLRADAAAVTSPKRRHVEHRPDRAGGATQVSSQQSTLTAKATGRVQAEPSRRYEQLVAVTPDDTATLSSSYAQSRAARGRHDAGARGATSKFLKLAPDDPKAAVVKQQIKALAQPPATIQ